MHQIVEAWLTKRARDVLPHINERGLAKRAHRELRDMLNTGEMKRRIARSYLSGSYRRHTATTPLNDVDIIFEINPERWKIGLFDDLPSPQQVITTFARALRERLKEAGQQSRVVEQGRSVGVNFGDIHIDVVPAISVNEEDDDDDLELSDGDDDDAENEDLVVWDDARTSDRVKVPDRRSDEWIASNPRAHVRIASHLNTLGVFKPCVRLLKTWNASRGRLVSSFAVESIAAHVFARENPDTLTNGLRSVWEFIAARGGLIEVDDDDSDDGVILHTRWHGLGTIEVPDIAGTGGNVVSGIAVEQMEAFTKNAEAAAGAIVSATRSRSVAAVEERLRKLFRVAVD